MRKVRAASSVHRLKVVLEGVQPPVWRRIDVPSDITLAKLHRVLQEAMGWQDAHMHEFVVGDRRFGVPDPEYGEPVESDRRARLAQVAPRIGSSVRYVYDFGDDWQHDILVEDIHSADPNVRCPICLGGERACPPEDCGGPGGYEDFLAAVLDPAHEEHERMLTWAGGSFDPEAFNVDLVNHLIRTIR